MNFLLLLTAVFISILLIVIFTSVLKYNTFLSIFFTTLILAVFALPLREVIPTIMMGFGNTLRSVGLIIIFGIILGLLLDKTGAAYSIAKAILRITGKHNSGMAIHYTGFVTGIPIFCDSGFIVLHGINRTLTRNSGKPMIFMATVLAAGLYSIHCLIPPHPGATAAAGIMNANIGELILYGIPVALIAATAGFLAARYLCRNESPEPLEIIGETAVEENEGLPSTFRSFLPIIIPLILLTGRSIALLLQPEQGNILFEVIMFVGEPIVALLIGIVLGISLYKKINTRSLNELFDLSIEKAGPILAITAAGGVFGTVIKATGVGETAGNYLATTGLGLFIPFMIAAFLKTAQGSSTVAVMTAASIVAPMVQALGLDSESGILLSTLAMGAGSMIVSHTNDSYFWVVTKFSDLEAKQTLKVFTVTTLVMGLVAFGVIFMLSKLMI